MQAQKWRNRHSGHILVKSENIRVEEILKISRKKEREKGREREDSHTEDQEAETLTFSTVTPKARGSWSNTFKILKENDFSIWPIKYEGKA